MSEPSKIVFGHFTGLSVGKLAGSRIPDMYNGMREGGGTYYMKGKFVALVVLTKK